mgnify:CR=1 FL=1
MFGVLTGSAATLIKPVMLLSLVDGKMFGLSARVGPSFRISMIYMDILTKAENW